MHVLIHIYLWLSLCVVCLCICIALIMALTRYFPRGKKWIQLESKAWNNMFCFASWFVCACWQEVLKEVGPEQFISLISCWTTAQAGGSRPGHDLSQYDGCVCSKEAKHQVQLPVIHKHTYSLNHLQCNALHWTIDRYQFVPFSISTEKIFKQEYLVLILDTHYILHNIHNKSIKQCTEDL